MKRPTLLIVSFSPIARDARVLKQVQMAVEKYDVTTCGFGPAPAGVVAHHELTHATLPGKTWDGLLQVKAYWAGYWLQPDVRAAWQHLRGRAFDVVLANDIESVPLALAVNSRHGVHADLHEYHPRLHEQHAPWRRRIGPWYQWLCRRYLPRVASVTTVADSLAQEYHREFGVEVGVVTNATPFQELVPTPVTCPIRLVHSGTSHRERNLMAIVEGALAVEGYTLDLYLTLNDPGHLAELKKLAEGEPRLTVHDPVPYAELVQTLNRYDVGVFLLPPINFSFAHALPNKIYDFAQARLATIISPSPEMEQLVRKYGCGRVAAGHTAEDLAAVLQELTVEQVTEMKAAAHRHASALSAEMEVPKWEAALEALLAR